MNSSIMHSLALSEFLMAISTASVKYSGFSTLTTPLLPAASTGLTITG